MKLLSRYRDPLVVLLLLLLPLIFYLSNQKDPRDHHVLDRIVLSVGAPVQWAMVKAIDGVSNTWDRYVSLIGVEEENTELRAEVGRLKSELARREEQAFENERLRRMMGLRERFGDMQMTTARVVAISPTPLFRSLRVDRGKNDGVTLGAAVVNFDGVVGRVAALGDDWADIMLLVDANGSLDVLVQRTRARARVRGGGDDRGLGIEMQYLARTEDVQPGDVLITSGVGSVFPKGLPVGRVTSVRRPAFGLYQEAQAEPNVDFRRIEEVMVMIYDADATHVPDVEPLDTVLSESIEGDAETQESPSNAPMRAQAEGVAVEP